MKIIKVAVLCILFFIIATASAYITLTFIIKSEDTVVVPVLINKDIVYTLEILTDLGLNTKVKGLEYSSDIPQHHVIFQDPEPGAEIKKGRDVNVIISKGTKTVLMPNVKGLLLQSARIILEENDLHEKKLSFSHSEKFEKDEIIAQFPLPGVKIPRDENVNLLVSLGKRKFEYMMPDIIGMPIYNAIYLIEQNNMSIGKIESVFCTDKPLNVITSQKPLSGYPVKEGSSVNIVINRKTGNISNKYINGTTGGALFTYKAPVSFLKKHIRVTLNGFGMSTDVYDDFIKSGNEIWILIPNNDTVVMLYEDGKLIKTEVTPRL